MQPTNAADPAPRPMARLQASTVTGQGRHLHLLRGLAALPDVRRAGARLRVLSFGCSTGHECLDLRQVFPEAEIHGCDVNPEALAEARERCGPQITVFESAVDTLRQHGPFDLIVAFNVFCRYPTTEGKDEIAPYFPIDRFDEGLRAVDACLRDGGVLALYNTPYFFEQSCLASTYRPAAGQDFADNGWMAKCRADGRRVTDVRVFAADGAHRVPDYALGLREGRWTRPFGDPRVHVLHEPVDGAVLPGSTRLVAWRKATLDEPVVVSFYAGADYYHNAAQALREDCARLGLDSDIVELSLPPGQGWIDICRRKSAFFVAMLRKHRRPVLWLDVDCRLVQRPDFLWGSRADFGACLRDFRYLREFDPAALPRTFHPGILYFGHTPAGLAFAELIARLEAEQPALDATDDHFLQEAWLQHQHALQLHLIPPACIGFEWPLAEGQVIHFGRSGQVGAHIGQAAQHVASLYTDSRRKAVLQREAADLGRHARPQEALVLLRRAYEIDPLDGGIGQRLARLLHRLGQESEAQQVLRELTERDPQRTDHLRRFGVDHDLAAGRLDRALAQVGELVERGTPEDRDWALSRRLRLRLELQARDRRLPAAQRQPLWWMETPYPGNFGDILNPYVIEKLTGVPPRWAPKGQGLLAIGSVIRFAQAGTDVWGAGTPRMSDRLSAEARYHAVRGPLTHELVQRSGGQCPAIYGDPACLLPWLYAPRPAPTRWRLGVIPHYAHEGELSLAEDVRLIPVRRAGYEGIEAFIDEVASCEAILTSSLHGLIVSHAYGVPAGWMDVTGAERSLPGDGTKFHDYLLSVGLPATEPWRVPRGTRLGPDDAARAGPLPPRRPDLRSLALAAPFTVLDQVLQRLPAFGDGSASPR